MHAHLLLNEEGDVPYRPLPSGGVAPMSQPTEVEGGDSPMMWRPLWLCEGREGGHQVVEKVEGRKGGGGTM